MTMDTSAGLRAAFPDYAELGITLDFSAEGYKGRLARIRALAVEGKGPMADLHTMLKGWGKR